MKVNLLYRGKIVQSTGKWKVVNIEGNSELYLECVVEEYEYVDEKVKAFFIFTINETVIKKKVVVKFLSEYDLNVETEYVNSCGE